MTTKAPIKTEVLEESSKRFGDGMSAFMDVSTQYIGYLRSKPTVQLTMREDESGVADFEEKNLPLVVDLLVDLISLDFLLEDLERKT